ncbi:Homoaconitase small subunit [Paraconexibacter sp. AEG42_29]|uniref:3-isopropylmalate dehydratase small subunit n=1 Tax=Paraconexibacter sp. AEG42_29 TaxID=2997339 RepID=A0AAU7AU23_9ACTN
MIIDGRVWVFGDAVDTDNMYPGFAIRMSPEEAAKHVFYDLRPGWTDEVRPGDIVVAGRNFGLGSSRPVATLFQHLGVAALIADEFNSLFLRNAVNSGLPAVTIPGVSEALEDGDEIRVDVKSTDLIRASDGLTLAGTPMPDYVYDIVARGGLRPKLQADGFLPA